MGATTVLGDLANSKPMNSKALRRMMRVFTLLFSLSLVLSILLIFLPYSLFYAYHDYVYQATHNFGLDPRDWFPFAWDGFGRFLYQLSFFVWGFAAYVAIPLIAVQFVLIYHNWNNLARVERILHPAMLISAVILSFYMLTGGQTILYWLQD